MSFFKNHNYISSKGLINSSTRSQGNVMQVGNIDSVGLITVLDESGNLKWNRAFKSPQGGYTTFVKVIPFKNGDFAVVGVTAYKTPVVMRIKGTGEVLWCKVFPSIETDERRIFADILADSMVYLTFHSVNTKTSGTLLLSGWEGNVSSRTDIINNGTPGATLEVTGISTFSEIVHISANETLNGVTRGVSFYGQVNEPVMTAHYPSVNGIPVVLNGVYCRPNQQGSYELHLGGKINNIPVLLAPGDRAFLFKDWGSQSVKFIHGKDFFYATTGAGSSFCYSDYNYTPVWTQQSLVKGFYIDQIVGNEVTIRGTHTSDFTGLVSSAINTCFTSPANNTNVSLEGYKYKEALYISNKVDFKEEDLNFDIINKPYANENACGSNGGDGTEITFNEFSGLQTPNFYLQAAGSRGEDSTKGIHLRWAFGGKLGENHLPKGKLTDNKNNFNKPDDFVKVYRTLYEKKIFNLDFTESPQLIDESKKMWVYKFNNDSRIFYVYFKNKTKYAQVRQSVNPMTDPLKFMEQYGNEIVEILCKTDIFFAAELRVENQQSDSVVELEALSIAEPNNLSQQQLSYRAHPYSFNGLANTYFNAENGKTLRFRPTHCLVTGIKFEFYSDFIISRNQANAWKLMGEFSLTDERDRAFDRLDPLPGDNPVHGAWLRYNDGAYVNTENYRMKWEHASTGPLDRDIQTVVKRYVELSNDQQNPKANETISINLSPTGSQQVVDISTNLPQDGDMQVSNLDILNIAALDYHVARMLGLGYLDIKDDVFGNEYIYIAEYYTNKNLDINSDDKTYQLLSMSLPVSTEIERLSLPVKLMKLNKGMDSNNPQSAGLYDAEGYSHNGKYRYISIYSQQVPEIEVNPTFMGDSQEFNASSFTFPVYAGLEYRVVEPGKIDDYQWIKPELCHDTKYANIDNAADSFETLPLQIPDTYAPLYMHKQDKSGTYFYKGYGINWFSRAQVGGEELFIETKIKPNNRLLPPTATTAFLIQKEYPVTLTSQGEQDRRNAITDPDKTLVRLGFDHHIYQDEIVYPIPFDSTLQDSYYLNPDAIFPDDKEVMADEVEIFYRNYTMKEISAKVASIHHHPSNQLLAEIKTVDYTLPSSGGTIAPGSGMPAQPSIPLNILKSEIPAGTTINDFIGGIFLLDGESYIINGIEVESTGLKFTVFKKAPSVAIIAGTSPMIDQSSLVLPTFSPGTEGLFSATENMQNTPTWGPKNPNSLKVKIGTNDWAIHREIIHTQQSDGSVQRFLEKSRGFWKTAEIEMHYEKIDKYQNSEGVVIDKPVQDYRVHRGVYKVTFPGFKLAKHSQFSPNSDSVEWFNGIVRLFTVEDYGNGVPKESRSIFKVVKTENIGTNQDLVLYIYDENFSIKENAAHLPIFNYHPDDVATMPSKPITPPVYPTDPVMGKNMQVNYYPSYRVYLYKNAANNLIENAVLPSENEDVRYSIFGFKSVDNDNVDMQGAKYKSKFSVPAVMFANRIVEPKPPRKPKGSMYATRPDKFGKSTYSFITEYDHKPYSVQFFRANNAVLLASLYEPLKIEEIKNRLNALGGNDEEFFTDRWMNFVDFEMLLNTTKTEFEAFPPDSPVKYALPLPNSKILLDAINYFVANHNEHFGLQAGQSGYANLLDETKWKNGQYPINYHVIEAVPNKFEELRLGHFIKEAMINCFLPLTEVPVIYQQIHNFDFNDLTGHRPKNKKQNIRDASGYLLPTTHADFDMAPMAAIYSQGQGGTPHSTLFTDFTLDGASDNFYFYGVRELGNQLQMGEFSKFQGPIKLVNTNPAEPPKILSLLPVVDNSTLGISAKVRIEVNSYTDVHKINEISIYRATNKLDADSILSMKHIKTVKIADVEVNPENGSWTVYDEFEDLDEKPYGDPLFYRVVASRKVEYTTIDYNVSPPASKTVQEQAPSLPSKTTVTMLVENYNPPAPVLRYHSEPVDSDVINWVILSWDQVCYKGKYHLYKMSPTGNWKEIARIDTDEKDTSKAKLYVYGNNPATNKEEWFLTETFDMTGNEFFLPVEKLGLDPMKIKDAEGRVLYHHFKMVSQNTSNMFSTEEKILTIYKEETWTDIGGISHDGTDGMILQGTFIVRP
ncbi:hypothetical protein [Chryseobacterium contaminans]|uniref:hypothetical protein n=1 Tax=Chryseobacterium contaminans TaxID=1423959 RepID=UPI0030159D41